MKHRLLNGEMIELSNELDSVTLWFSEKTNCFCLMLNTKVIKATKTWKPIETKLDSIGNLEIMKDIEFCTNCDMELEYDSIDGLCENCYFDLNN